MILALMSFAFYCISQTLSLLAATCPLLISFANSLETRSETTVLILLELFGTQIVYLASGDFYPLLITFANSLEPNQDRQNVSPDMDPNCLVL